MQKQYKNLQGSVLVFTLLVLSLLLSVTLSVAGVVITEKNSSSATQKSALAFQVADGATENVLKRIYKDNDASLADMATALKPQSSGLNGDISVEYVPQCFNGAIRVMRLPDLDAGSYSVSFFDTDSQPLQCSGPGYDTNAEWRTKVARIVSTGTYGGATRAIDTTIRPAPCGGVTTVVDTRDTPNVTYNTVEIGNQCWMQQNMNVGTRINGSTAQTDNGTIEKYCYNDISGNCTVNHPNQPDGGLYSWNEAMQYSTTEGAQGICPDGWHVPSDNEWYILENLLKDTGQACNASRVGYECISAGTQLKSGGTARFNFNLAGGTGGAPFAGRDSSGWIWTSSEVNAIGARFRGVGSAQTGVARGDQPKNQAFSVRCLKD